MLLEYECNNVCFQCVSYQDIVPYIESSSEMYVTNYIEQSPSRGAHSSSVMKFPQFIEADGS